MTLHSIRLVVEKRRGEETLVRVAEHTWRRPNLPNRMLFTAMLEEMYERVELPYFPHRVEAQVELHDRVLAVKADEPVAPPDEVALALWAAMDKAASGL